MLTIYALAEQVAEIQQIIHSEDRLGEVVTVQQFPKEEEPKSPYLSVSKDNIHIPILWDQSQPPYLLPEEVAYSQASLLGLIYHYLENDQKAWEFLNGSDLYPEIQYQLSLKYGAQNQAMLKPETAREWHNLAILQHYGLIPAQSPMDAYHNALEFQKNPETKAFTLREIATLYLDMGNLSLAGSLLESASESVMSEAGRQAISLLKIKLWMQQLVVPYSEELLDKIKKTLWEVLTYYEKTEKDLQVGLLLLDATHIANISESFSEALGYIKRAIDIFDKEGMDELAASAHLQKGTLLGTWAQNGNPQFYRPAVEAYQKSLYVFTKADRPDIFADIQHKLGVLYAEMPDEHKKRGIWAGIASASFQEALSYFNKEQFPYEYASVCNNFANAYLKFPPALHSDNHVKALHYYQEALEIRTPQYPYERALTLLNYLEASWDVGNDPSSFNHARFEDMMAKAEEVKTLVDEPDMHAVAQQHLENLSRLKEALTQEVPDA